MLMIFFSRKYAVRILEKALDLLKNMESLGNDDVSALNSPQVWNG